MKKILFVIVIAFFALACNNEKKSEAAINKNKLEASNDTIYPVQSGGVIQCDTFGIDENSLYVTVIGHGSLMFEYKGRIIHVDPYSEVADYSKLPKADLILGNKECNQILKYGEILNNGDSTSWNGLNIKAIPAYNIVHKRPDGYLYHPKGQGNGYVIKFNDGRIVYIAADIENIPELDELKGIIDIAFLPQNLPYTMDEQMYLDAAKRIMPKTLYKYHANQAVSGYFQVPNGLIQFPIQFFLVDRLGNMAIHTTGKGSTDIFREGIRGHSQNRNVFCLRV